ncbi:MAG: polymer-forming cytoskeletal protein [candidate division WOR-3 bacterium]
MKIFRFFGLVLIICALAIPLSAAKLISGEKFVLQPDETLNSDMYFGGQVLDISGKVNGTVHAGCKEGRISGSIGRNLFLAGEKMSLTGSVSGDILGCASELNINGLVGGGLRAAARTVQVKGTIGADLLAVCQELRIDSTGEVNGDVFAWCQSLDINGTVTGNIRAIAQKVIIGGRVEGDVNLTLAADGGELVLSDDAQILGNLNYKAYQEIDIGNRDAVKGKINFTLCTLPKTRRHIFSGIAFGFFIYSLLAALVITFILIAIGRVPLERVIETTRQHFGATIGLGAIGLFAPPLALLIAAIFLITIPVVIIAKICYLIIFYLAKTLTGMFLGRTLFRVSGASGVSLWLSGPIGVIIVYCLCQIPVIGWLFWLIALLIGFGIFIRLLSIIRKSTLPPEATP